MDIKRTIKMLLLLGCILGMTTSCCTRFADSRVLPVTLWPQETGQWCWAASGQMCMDFLGNNVAQCTQANNRFGMANCCNSPTPSTCVTGGWPEFSKYNFTSKNTVNAALTWDQIRREIDCKDRPFTYTWHWAGGSGHMVTIVGYSVGECDGEKYLHVHNPLPVNVGSSYTITYDAYVAGNPGSSHWNDYYAIIPTR
ncbi:C39 family peptidase [Aquimarina sp. 2-A2]|uniref:C39 family peptidase n=1 Tax=Aquimarina sp. 2-A2 TaxID=3382644 RepID=UPI00387EF339